MADHIDLVASDAMDLYYQNFKNNNEFWTIDDFRDHCAGLVANYYQQQYQAQYAELRQEKKDEVVAFDPETLNEQVVEVKQKDGRIFAKLEKPVASFPYDQQGIGVQELFAVEQPAVTFERSTLSAAWQLNLIPFTNRIFFYLERGTLQFVKKGICNVPKKIRVLYVPSTNDPDFMVPDGIREYIVTTAAMTIKEVGKGTIVKTANDGNVNKTIETEINKMALK